jgi:hypothetical protein
MLAPAGVILGPSDEPTPMNSVPIGSTDLLPDIPWEGTLIQEKGSSDRFWIQNGQKRLIVSQTVFDNHKFNSAAVLTAPKGGLAQIPDGQQLTS